MKPFDHALKDGNLMPNVLRALPSWVAWGIGLGLVAYGDSHGKLLPEIVGFIILVPAGAIFFHTIWTILVKEAPDRR